MDVKEEQPLNAEFPIEVTELGIVVVEHPAINVFVDVSIIPLQLFLESYTALFASTKIDAKEEQPPNTKFPIEVTELGIVMDVKEEQLLNA